MKKKLLALLLLCALALTSCGGELPTEISYDTTAPASEEVTAPASEAVTAPTLPDKDFTELDGNLQFYRFDNDNAAVVWNEKSAWVFDFVLDKVVTLFDNEKALADIDIRGEAGKYFGDYTLSLDFLPNKDYELQVTFDVRSTTHDAAYKAYVFYSLNSPLDTPRGDVRGYYCESLAYPESDAAVTITDVSDRDKLFLTEENYLFDLIAAIVTVDTAGMEKCMNADAGTFDPWKGIKVSEYTITRTDFTAGFTDRLDGTMTVSESSLDTMPAGKYSISVFDGPGQNVVLTPLDRKVEPRALSEAETWLYPWVTYYGGNHYTDYENYGTAENFHDLVDFYFSCTREAHDYDDFLVFCEAEFARSTMQGFVRNRGRLERVSQKCTHFACIFLF